MKILLQIIIKRIKSNKESILTDQRYEYLNNFEYTASTNIFKSVGFIKIQDKLDNLYEFSQIYIDTKKKEIIGTDSKAFFNDENIKINKENDPRIFSNVSKITKNKSTFDKSIFTLCKYRKNDKFPPWTIQSKKMLHDNKKKTIYYENAIVKVLMYLFFIFQDYHILILQYRVGRVFCRQHFMTLKFSTGISVPYFFNLGIDKNFTLTNRLYATGKPLFLGEYHQAFRNSNFLTDFGYTEGYKNLAQQKSWRKVSFF